jgi:uncharacterized protein (DUF342 family)
MSRVYLICQHCGERLKVMETLAGRKVRCPSCLGVSLVRHLIEGDSSPRSPIRVAGKSTIDAPVEDIDSLELVSELKLRLEIDPEGRFAGLHVEVGAGGIPDRRSVLDVMATQSIVHGIDLVALDTFYDQLASGKVLHGHQLRVAHCTDPRPPVGARVEVVEEPRESDAPTADVEDDDEARVDFKDSGRIFTVACADVVAHLYPGEPGHDGICVRGEPIVLPDGELVGDVLGEGVSLDADGRTIRATQSGRVVHFENVLSVLQVYQIESDVDFSTGNIRFDGHVIVKGSVLDEFEIECKSLEVEGSVGAATIFVEADAVLSGGINGNGKCRLFIGGRCEAKYVNQVTAHIGGDLVVERGITNSEIICWGGLSASRVVGGKSSARMGYLIEDLGSDLGVVTVVAPGLIALPSFYGHQGKEVEEQADSASKRLELKVEMHSDVQTTEAADAQAPTVSAISVRQALLNRFLGKKAVNCDVERGLVERVDVVNITSKMFADVVVCSASRCREFVERSAGKMSIRLNEETGEFEKMPFRKLRVTRNLA